MENSLNTKTFFIGNNEDMDYTIPMELKDYLEEKAVAQIVINKDRSQLDHSKFDTDGFYLQTVLKGSKLSIGIFYNFALYEEFLKQSTNNRSNRFSQSASNTRFIAHISQGCLAIAKKLDLFFKSIGFVNFIDGYYEETLFKKQPYTFIDAKLSKDGSYLTLITKEFGEYGIPTWQGGGVQSILNFFEELSGFSKAFEKAKERIKKSVQLDICYITISPCRSTTELHIYDSKGTRKVTQGFMLYHGVNFFTELNEKYFNNPKFYMLIEENGTIFAFDMQKAVASGAIVASAGIHYVATKNFKKEIPNFSDFSLKFMESCDDKEWAASELLKLEILG